MDPSVAIAIASLVGAGAFFSAGFVAARRRNETGGTVAHAPEPVTFAPAPAATVTFAPEPPAVTYFAPEPEPEPEPPTRPLFTPAPQPMPSSATEPMAIASPNLPPAALPPLGGSLDELMHQLATHSGSTGVAIFDDEGLPLHVVGSFSDFALAALVGLVGRSVRDAHGYALVGDAGVLELQDDRRGTVRCRSVHWNGRWLWLTTMPAPGRAAVPDVEDAVLAAIPTLLA